LKIHLLSQRIQVNLQFVTSLFLICFGWLTQSEFSFPCKQAAGVFIAFV